MNGAVKYFPLVGALIGLICGAALLAAARIWEGPLPALAAVSLGIAITGALHEDGLADFFDALGGSTREARIAIMKDSRLGTYGALALGVCVAAKVFTLSALMPPIAAAALAGASTGGRSAMVFGIQFLSYAGNPEAAKIQPLAKPELFPTLALASFFGLAPAVLLPPAVALAALLSGVAAAAILALQSKRLIGGYTGDVLGGIEQAYEVGFLLGAAACA